VQNLVDIFEFDNPLSDELVLLVALLDLLEMLAEIVLVDGLVHGLGLETLFERVLDAGMLGLDFFLHVFGDGVGERGELHVDFDHIFMRQAHYFLVDKLLGGEFAVEERVEMRVDDDLLLPIFH
jgi:hypothetical protein